MASSSNLLHRMFRIDAAHHGRHTEVQADNDINLEVISLGLPRTGTTTLAAALEILGYGPCYQGVDLWRTPPRRQAFSSIFTGLTSTNPPSQASVAAQIRRLMRGYRSSTDNPVPFLVRETYAAYPDAKYILSLRDSRDQWWKSYQIFSVYFQRDWARQVFRACTFSVSFMRTTYDYVQVMARYGKIQIDSVSDSGRGPELGFGPEMYDMHTALVRKTVPNEQLLDFNVKEGWPPLCKFLDCDIPDEPFPQLNEAESMRIILAGMQMFGLFVWALYACNVCSCSIHCCESGYRKGTGEMVFGIIQASGYLKRELDSYPVEQPRDQRTTNIA